MGMYEVTCLYWVHSKLGLVWEPEMLEKVENYFLERVRAEIMLQKELERERDANTDRGLQTMTVDDLNSVHQMYKTSSSLQEVSKNYKEIEKVIK